MVGEKEKEIQRSERKKILVLGASIPSNEIISYLWEKLPKDLNFEDFNLVFLDMTRFEDKNFIEILPDDCLIQNTNFENFLFCKENELIVIGYPYAYKKKRAIGEVELKFVYNFPFYPEFIHASGDEIKLTNKEYEFYFVNVKSWKMHLKSNSLDYQFRSVGIPNYIRDNFSNIPSKLTNYVNISPIALTLTKHPIAFSFHISILFSHQITSATTQIVTVSTATVTNLPPTTTISIEEAIKSILINRYKMTLEISSPEWVCNYKTPIQNKIDTIIANLQKDKFKIESDIKAQFILLKHEEIFQKLLYEQGVVLQMVVHDALELLGAKVDRTDERKDDGKLITPNGEDGILEIKSSKKTISLADILQLDNWKVFAEEKDKIPRKGILIANCYIEKDISERDEYFPDNCIKKSEKNDFCLVKTSQLYKAICLLKDNKLNKNDFWNEIFSTNGICKLEDL
jgi:hypothetical protein